MELLSPETGLVFWTVFSLLSIIITIIALLNLLKTAFRDSTTKLIWLLVILFVPMVGPLFYFTIGRKQGQKAAN
ncbi:PLD nuclease N-terminal domain-containing protein [Solitalea sp. MAHUQ-68]|uniref:PLD nuclease N-terminal domain-containing protein n=1 Tax=Solitalea agri TaxID=2953739 RepID=A0A9X2F0W4_9SPHI|nr:PLD nuclease N-terminal domain-containing protein [Solitalea agri]MCO4292065.1 PLD nuclease N-terminal domain-containing protein [Solitalea agri]